jgi:hypothetical protein
MTVIPFPTTTSRTAPIGSVPGSTAPPATGRLPALPVAGTFGSPSGSGGTFVGHYRLERCTSQFGQLAVAGVFTGELVDSRGARLGVGARRTTVACHARRTHDGIEVQVGPVDVNLLGLLVTVGEFSVDVRRSACEAAVGDVLGPAPVEELGRPVRRA